MLMMNSPLNFKTLAPKVKEIAHQLKFLVSILLNGMSNLKYVNVCVC